MSKDVFLFRLKTELTPLEYYKVTSGFILAQTDNIIWIQIKPFVN